MKKSTAKSVKMTAKKVTGKKAVPNKGKVWDKTKLAFVPAAKPKVTKSKLVQGKGSKALKASYKKRDKGPDMKKMVILGRREANIRKSLAGLLAEFNSGGAVCISTLAKDHLHNLAALVHTDLFLRDRYAATFWQIEDVRDAYDSVNSRSNEGPKLTDEQCHEVLAACEDEIAEEVSREGERVIQNEIKRLMGDTTPIDTVGMRRSDSEKFEHATGLSIAGEQARLVEENVPVNGAGTVTMPDPVRVQVLWMRCSEASQGTLFAATCTLAHLLNSDVAHKLVKGAIADVVDACPCGVQAGRPEDTVFTGTTLTVKGLTTLIEDTVTAPETAGAARWAVSERDGVVVLGLE